MSKVKIVLFAADPLSAPPYGRDRLLLDEEVRRNRRAVRESDNPDALVFDVRMAPRTDDLLQALNEACPQVVHFSGHGGEEGLVLVGADGHGTRCVDAEALGELFQLFRDDVRVVVLNACFSLPQATAIAEAVGCAIGTPHKISDSAAIIFGASFYRAIAFGKSVQVAYDQACSALSMEKFSPQERPRLVVRPGVDASKLILVPTRRAPAAVPEPEAPREIEEAPRPQRRSLPIGLLASTKKRRVGRGTKLTLAGVAVAGVVATAMIIGEDDVLAQCGTEWSGPARASDGMTAPASSSATRGARSAGGSSLASAKLLHQAGDHAAAFPLFRRAAETGNPEAMTFVGIAYRDGQGTAPRADSAAHWLREAATKRDVPGMIALALAYRDGKVVDPSRRYARYWLKTAATEKDDAEAMRTLANIFRDEQKFDTAFVWYRKAVQSGSLDARVDVGGMYEEGQGISRDPDQARCLYRTAAEVGSLRGMVALGRLYQAGIGVPRDYAQARKWYLKAADAGSAEGMNGIGELYRRGLGVPQSRNEANRWFGRARDASSRIAASSPASARAH